MPAAAYVFNSSPIGMYFFAVATRFAGVLQSSLGNVGKLPEESVRLMGFPSTYIHRFSDRGRL
jgi:hypothetical protein